MEIRPALHAHLEWPTQHNPLRAATVAAIEALAGAALELSRIIAAGPLAGIVGESGGVNQIGRASCRERV